jgi:H+-transporting ATPase
MDVLCADKTGTLTANRLSITRALAELGFTEAEVLRYGSLASNEANQDPIDLAFLRAAQERKLLQGTERGLSFVPFSPQTRRTEALVQIEDGTVRVIKGAVETVAEIAGLDVGERATLRTPLVFSQLCDLYKYLFPSLRNFVAVFSKTAIICAGIPIA